MLLGVVSIIAVLYNNCYNCCVGSFLTLLTVSPLSQVTRKAEQIVWLASIGSKHYNGSVVRELQLGPTRKVLTVLVPHEEWRRARLTILSTTPCRSYNYAIDTKVRRASSISSFQKFRTKYLLVLVAVMLADGLQGTHLYALYHGYGFNVPNLYATGFIIGAVTSPFIGPLVDKFGRRKSAMIYCFLEMIINALEQYNFLPVIIVSRLIGGVTTNLLFTVFESWLITEHRRRGFPESQLAILLRDSVVSSNLSAIGSGFLAHVLAESFGPAGPFKGTVVCSGIALILVGTQWEENYGNSDHTQSLWNILCEATSTILSDSKILRLGLIQALTEGALQTFVFLWAPFLLKRSKFSSKNIFSTLGLDSEGLPAFGLIFGLFMLSGALGGLTEPLARNLFARLMTPSPTLTTTGAAPVDTIVSSSPTHVTSNTAKEDDPTTPFTVEMLSALCFLVCSALLLIPQSVSYTKPSHSTFTLSLIGFLAYEYIVGIYLPCEGIMRSIYMPSHSVCSVMTILRVVVNVSVAVGVAATNYISLTVAFNLCSLALVSASFLQLTLVRKQEWEKLQRTIKNTGFEITSSKL